MGPIGGERGVSPAEASKIILTRIARETGEEIARSEVKGLIEKHLGDRIPEDAEDAVDKAKDLINKIGN